MTVNGGRRRTPALIPPLLVCLDDVRSGGRQSIGHCRLTPEAAPSASPSAETRPSHRISSPHQALSTSGREPSPRPSDGGPVADPNGPNAPAVTPNGLGGNGASTGNGVGQG